MKKQFVVFMIIFLGLSWACSKDEDNLLPVIEPDDSGVFTDAEGREFSWVRYGNLEWMTTNLIGSRVPSWLISLPTLASIFRLVVIHSKFP